MENIRYYKKIALLYDTIVPRDIKGVCDSVEEIIRRYTSKKEILDLGCGTGRFTTELTKRGFRMIGMDLTDEMIEVARGDARKEGVKVRFTKGDIRNFKLDNRIGIIWARGSIGDLNNINDVKRAFRNIRNNLLKKGIFIFDVRDFFSYMKNFKDGIRNEHRVFRQKNKIITLNFSAELDKKTKIERMKGEIVVKTGKNIEKYEVKHILRYYTRKDTTNLLSNDECKIIDSHQVGYKLDKKKKPQYVVVAE